MIYPLVGNDLGVGKNDKHALFEWHEHGKVVFSATQLGDALSFHFAADKPAMRHIKTAINDFCDWAVKEYNVRMLLGLVLLPSVGRVLVKCGFVRVQELKLGYTLYRKC